MDVKAASELIECCCILHNMCIDAGDNHWEDEDLSEASEDEDEDDNGQAQGNEVRRQELLQYFAAHI